MSALPIVLVLLGAFWIISVSALALFMAGAKQGDEEAHEEAMRRRYGPLKGDSD